MKHFLYFLAVIIYSLLIYRYGFVEGFNDANYDRNKAAFELKNCYELLTKRD